MCLLRVGTACPTAKCFPNSPRGTVQVMVCEEKSWLVTEYHAATQKFLDAVTTLQRRMGTSSKDDYDRLQRATDDARVKCEQARLTLEQHIAAHRC